MEELEGATVCCWPGPQVVHGEHGDRALGVNCPGKHAVQLESAACKLALVALSRR